MRLTFGAFRSGVRNPGFSVSGPGITWRTPYPTRRRALRVYHEQGIAAADAVWDHAMASQYANPPRLRTWALNTRRAFRAYVRWDQQDGRPFGDLEVPAEMD
jgi:hypothetical protein